MFQRYWQRLLLLLVAGMLIGSRASAQSTPSPLSGKSVGIYLSLKALQFDDPYYKPFGAWLQLNDSLNLQYEEIRLAVAVKLGNYLTQVLQEKLGTDTAYFINADAEMGKSFLTHYRDGQLDITAFQKAVPAETDYILVIDQLRLTGQFRDVVYSYSNELITDRMYVHKAKVQAFAFAFNPVGRSSSQLAYDGEKSPNRVRFYTASEKAPPAEKILDRLFNTLIADLFR